LHEAPLGLRIELVAGFEFPLSRHGTKLGGTGFEVPLAGIQVLGYYWFSKGRATKKPQRCLRPPRPSQRKGKFR
jgi:hypothetical protein